MPNQPLTPEEYAAQMAEYNRRMEEYRIKKAAYDKMYGGGDAAGPTPPPVSNQPPQIPTQGPPVEQGKQGLFSKFQKPHVNAQSQQPQQGYQAGYQEGYPQPQGQQGVQGQQSIQGQQGAPSMQGQQGTQGQMPPAPPGGKPPKKSKFSEVPVLGAILAVPKRILVPVIILVIIGILLVGTLVGGDSSEPDPKPKTTTSSSSSSKPKETASSQPEEPSEPESSAPSVKPEDKDKSSIDRVLKPGMTESLGNLMELYNEVVFPSALSVPEPEPVVDKTTINLGGSYVFRPNRNWSSRIDGNSITLVHDEGIVAKFIFNKNKKPLKPEQMKTDVFPQFLEGFGVESATYNEIFYNTQLAGVSTKVLSKFNDQGLVIETGMLNCNREILTYVISYYETTEVYPEEIIESLLNTITWKSTAVTFTK